jgi:uncharacterized protein involved in type VI secretion and phage assembly
MGSGLHKEMVRGAAGEIARNDRWLICETAIVTEVDDPDKQHRIKVTIPSIDEEMIFDDWIRPATPFAMGDGFGSVFVPAKGSEVLIIGVLGQKFNFVYFGAVYNEENKHSGQLSNETPGIHVPGNLSFIAELLLKLQAQNIHVIAQQLAKMTGENTEVIATQLAKMTGNTIELTAEGLAKLTGGQVEINSNGTIKIQGGNVQITGSQIKLHNRTVNPTGPSI